MREHIISLFIAGGIRYFLATSQYANLIENRVEIATPVNSFKRLKEGIYLQQQGTDPYAGDMVHEMPLILWLLVRAFETAPNLVPLLYVLLDLLTACILYKFSVHFVRLQLTNEKAARSTYAVGTDELQMQPSDIETVPHWVLLVYLFNPLSVLSCSGLTSTVFSNLLLALTLYCLCQRRLIPSLLFLAVETMRSLYPVVLVAPIVLVFARRSWAKGSSVVALFAIFCSILAWINYRIMNNSWSYLDGTLGFIFFYRDLQPNIGLYWYFFTEMFEHFRTMFLITFQMNATVLYLVPLSLKLRKEPMLLATVLIALMSIFRSYPCLGDVSFYLALLPLWKRCWKFMAHNFIVFCFFTMTLLMLPVLWHLWIYAGSANANFYFGTTLAFSTGQIFLVTDLLFAYVKREFCLLNGQKIYINGKEAKIILE